MSDILERLRNPAWTEHDGQRLILDPEQTQRDMLTAAAEIEHLRSIAGAVSDGPSMADIKARNDRLAEALKHVFAPLPAWTSGDKP